MSYLKSLLMRLPIWPGLVLLLTSIASAQYKFETWSTGQGLPYKTINSIRQTRDGYLWMTTNEGLARFDGVRFTIFNTVNSKGLLTNRLQKMVESQDGSLWIVGDERGLIRYQDGSFSSYTSENGLPSNKIYALFADPAVNRLLMLTDKGLVRWEDEQFFPAQSVESVDFAPSNRGYLALDNTGILYAKENDVLRRFAPTGIQIYQLPDERPDSQLLAVYQDRNQVMWVSTFYTGEPNLARLYAFKAGQCRVYTAKDGLPNLHLRGILEDRKGNMWFSGSGGLLKLENDRFHLFTKADGLSGMNIFNLLEDREGSIWAGTGDNGLTRISEQFITTYTSEQDGLWSDNIYPLYEDSDGVVWIGAWRNTLDKKGGLDKFENGKITHFAQKGQITSYLVTSLLKDRSGSLWIGAYGGATRFKDGKFTQVIKEIPHDQRNVLAMLEDSAGNIWFGTESGLIVWRDEIINSFNTEKGLPHNNIKFLWESRDKTIWIGTAGGLASFKDGVMTDHTHQNEFPKLQIRSIYEDADGTLWFGTYDSGLIRYRDGSFKTISVKDGLFDQGAFQILEDGRGWFWISSNHGIYRVKREELNELAEGKRSLVTSISYGVKDGMLDEECNGGTQPAGFKSKRDGTLWFPTQKGIAVINPDKLPFNAEPPTVTIEECLLDREQIASRDGIEILPGNNSLEIHYTGLSFIKPEQMRFKYKLEGLDRDWIEAGFRRAIYYDHLPPGEYLFRVTAANADGVWNTEGTSLKVVVKPPFYRTFWFLGLCLAAGTGALTFGHRYRIRRLKKAHADQEELSRRLIESQEIERKRIAAELHDSLGQELLVIKNWAMVGLLNDESPQSQLVEIKETASQALNEVREIAYNLRPYHLDELGLTKAIESVLDRVSKSSSIVFEADLDFSDHFFSKEAEIVFYRIVQECINNIIKHSNATRAGIEIKSSQERLHLRIWDNGSGFDTNGLASTRAEQKGFGLAGIYERARIIGGKVVINSAPGQGTIVTLTIDTLER